MWIDRADLVVMPRFVLTGAARSVKEVRILSHCGSYNVRSRKKQNTACVLEEFVHARELK